MGAVKNGGTNPTVFPMNSGDIREPADRGITNRFLAICDLCLIWASAAIARQMMALYAQTFQYAPPPELETSKQLGSLLLFSILVVLFLQLQRDYASLWKKSIQQEAKFLWKAVLGSALITSLCSYLFGSRPGSKASVSIAVVLSWVILATWRKFLRSQHIAGLTEMRNVLIVGCGPNGKQLRNHVENNPQLGYAFKGYIDRRFTGRPPDPARNKEEAFILGPADKLGEIARAHFVDEVFVSVPSDRLLVKLVARNARKAGVQVRVIPDLYDGLAAGQPVEYIGALPTLTIHRQSIPTSQLVMKRLADILLSALALIVLMPLLLLIALIVKLDSRGPALYESFRVGRKGNTFRCCKFRTMVLNAEALKHSLSHLNEREGILFKISADPRTTRAGRALRKYSIDELPQLWNVLKGDMSLVGPRPPLPEEYDKYALEHLCRLDVTPGVTGLWQVKARQNPSFESYIELDREYVNNWSFWLDCQILWKTISVVIAGTGQ
jgi:exopolysaccharide biosynthesis polyprenyl glycosylphosphotransferase